MSCRAAFLAACCAVATVAAEETIQEALEADGAEARIELQLTASEFADAATAAERLVEQIEDRSYRYDPELTRPLTLLGDARLGLGDAPGALDAYDRALHVARVNHGLFDPSQVEIVYREALVHATMGDIATADGRHEYAFNVLLRAYGSDDRRLVPGLFALADWYHDNHRVFSARRVFDRAVTITTRDLPPGDPRAIRALQGVAATFRDERFPRNLSATRNRPASTAFRDSARNRSMTINNFAPGERALIAVVNLRQADPDATQVDIAEAMLELADWYLLFEKHDRAFALYERVWQLLKTDTTRLDGVFASPTPLYLPLPPNPKPPSDARGEPHSGVVELALSVTDRGVVNQLDIGAVRAQRPDGLQGAQAGAPGALSAGLRGRGPDRHGRRARAVQLPLRAGRGRRTVAPRGCRTRCPVTPGARRGPAPPEPSVPGRRSGPPVDIQAPFRSAVYRSPCGRNGAGHGRRGLRHIPGRQPLPL